jgi:hypothetical protein
MLPDTERIKNLQACKLHAVLGSKEGCLNKRLATFYHKEYEVTAYYI